MKRKKVRERKNEIKRKKRDKKRNGGVGKRKKEIERKEMNKKGNEKRSKRKKTKNK